MRRWASSAVQHNHMTEKSIITGVGLHSGQQATLELARHDATEPVQIERNGVARPLSAFRVARTRFSTHIACDAFDLRTVEHLFAALAGLGVRRGLRLVVSGGDELPMLGGGAVEYAHQIARLAPSKTPPALRVARAGRIEVEGSTYELEPGDVHVEVDVELPAPCTRTATWNGRADAFVTDIAAARTFAIEEDVAELTRLGFARHVDPKSVLVVSADGTIHGHGVIAPDEPARHKLLDLIGDAYLYGGPPRGTMRVTRPGHTRNHAAFAQALARGLLVRDDG